MGQIDSVCDTARYYIDLEFPRKSTDEMILTLKLELLGTLYVSTTDMSSESYMPKLHWSGKWNIYNKKHQS